jgi:hypothetical protein
LEVSIVYQFLEKASAIGNGFSRGIPLQASGLVSYLWMSGFIALFILVSLGQRNPEKVFENNCSIFILKGDTDSVGTNCLSTLSQNISFVHVDEDVRLGQRIDMIRFGSQVDLKVQKLGDIKLEVKPSEQVVAGQSAIAPFKDIGEQMREVQEYSDAQSSNS